MAKFKCEVEIDWVEDEDTIDDRIKREIAKQIVFQFKEKDFAPIIAYATETLRDKADALVVETLQKFMAKKIVITDQWGNITEEYGNVDELLQDKFDDYITESVDHQGKAHPKKGCSVSGTPRIIYHIEKRVKEQCDRYSERILKDVDRRIETKLIASLKSKISNTLVKKIDLTSVIDS